MPQDGKNAPLSDEQVFDLEGEASEADDDEGKGAAKAPADDVDDEELPEQIIDVAPDGEDPKPVPAEGKGGEEKESYGKKVDRRIAKLTGRFKQENATQAQEISGLKRRLYDSEGEALNSTVSGLKTELEGIKGKLKQAFEDGNTDDQVDLQTDMVEVQTKLLATESRRDVSGHRPATDDGTGKPEPAAAPAPAAPAAPAAADPYAGMRPKAKVWAKRIGFADLDPSQRGLALGIDQEIANEGFDQNTDDYFDELDRRLELIFPDLYKDPDEQDPPDPPDEPRPRPAKKVEPSVRSSSPTPPNEGNGGTKVKLGPADYANMRKFKLDPKNPEHLKAYAAERRRS